MNFRHFTALVAACILPLAAAAQDNITRIIVPFAAGGATDVVARQLAENLTRMWGQRVIVENKPGAAGTIASRQLVTAAPDGRTLIIVASGHAINELIHENLPYKTVGDFTPIAQVADIPNVLLVPKDSPYRTVADLIAAAKDKPGALTYGTAGIGTSVHLAGEMFKFMTGVSIEPVHFKGDSESLTNVMGAHIPASFNTVPGAKAQLEAGNVRALGVTSDSRAPTFKDVPTIGEAGVRGYAVSNWFGILGPKGMDPQLVTRLNADIRQAMTEPATAQRFENLGMIIKVTTPGEFDALIRGDIVKWKPVVDRLGLRNRN